MVFVDFGNSFLRGFLAGGGYLRHHERVLTNAIAALRAIAASRSASRSASRANAVVLDIDEVLLSNIHMNSFVEGDIDFHASDYFSGPDGNPWPRHDLRLNPLLPGARALLEVCRELGHQIFLVTGRRESLRAETMENFVYVGIDDFWHSGPANPLPLSACLFMRPEDDSDASVRLFKEHCRRAISTDYEIVMTVGDQASDFGEYTGQAVYIPHPFYFTA